MEKQPQIMVSKEILKKVFQDPFTQELMREHISKGYSEPSLNSLINYTIDSLKKDACPPIEIIVKDTKAGRNTKKKLEATINASTYFLKVLEAELKIAREEVFGTKAVFIKPIEKGSQSYKLLIQLFQQIEPIYQEGAFGILATTRKEFYKIYLKLALPKISGKTKFNISKLLENRVEMEVLSQLSIRVKCKEDSHASLTIAMLATFTEKSGREEWNIFPERPEYHIKFIEAVDLLQEARNEAKDQSDEATLKFIPAWVEAQLSAYKDHYNEEQNLKVELGYLAGPGSIERYKEWVGNKKRKIKSEKIRRKLK